MENDENKKDLIKTAKGNIRFHIIMGIMYTIMGALAIFLETDYNILMLKVAVTLLAGGIVALGLFQNIRKIKEYNS